MNILSENFSYYSRKRNTEKGLLIGSRENIVYVLNYTQLLLFWNQIYLLIKDIHLKNANIAFLDTRPQYQNFINIVIKKEYTRINRKNRIFTNSF